MKMCNAEIMKKIKELETEKENVLSFERRNYSVTYQNDSDKISSDYNFDRIRTKVDEINKVIRYMKYLLNFANCTVIVEGFDMTIGECLVLMAQLNNEKIILDELAQKNTKTRQSIGFNKAVEFTELAYDVDRCKEVLLNISDRVRRLQIAIDRTNLNNEIEVNI